MRELIIILLVSFLSLERVSCVYDKSFKRWCDQHGKGSFVKSENQKYSSSECKWDVTSFAKDEKEAHSFCKHWSPVNVRKVEKTSDGRLQCTLGTSIYCQNDGFQLRGKCYRFFDNYAHYTNEEAKENCKKLGGNVASFDSADFPHLLNAFYPYLTMVWVDMPSTLHQMLEIGDNAIYPALVFGSSISYRIRSQTLVKVGKSEKALALCEVKKVDSGSIVDNQELISELYHLPSITSTSFYVRSANTYRRNFDDKNGKSQHDVCKRMLKAFNGGSDGHEFFSSSGSKHVVKSNLEKDVFYARLPYHADFDVANRVKPLYCVNFPGYSLNYVMIYKGVLYKIDTTAEELVKFETFQSAICDSDMSAVLINHNGKSSVLPASDANRAPIFCQLDFEQVDYRECDKGFSKFVRPSGDVFCHLVSDKNVKVRNEEARAKCESMNSYLSGFETEEERAFLISLVSQVGVNYYWLGAERRESCQWGAVRDGKGYVPDENDQCSKKNVFEWKHGVASNQNSIIGNNWAENEPTYNYARETFLSLIYMNSAYWTGFQNGTLNDDESHRQHGFICGKRAELSS